MEEEINPEQIELVTPSDKEVDEQLKSQEPEDAAAMLFGLYWPIFQNVVNGLSTKSLRRLIKAMVAIPLETANVNLKLPIEKTAYAISERLMQSKVLMFVHMMYQNQDQLKPFEEIESSAQKSE